MQFLFVRLLLGHLMTIAEGTGIVPAWCRHHQHSGQSELNQYLEWTAQKAVGIELDLT